MVKEAGPCVPVEVMVKLQVSAARVTEVRLVDRFVASPQEIV